MFECTLPLWLDVRMYSPYVIECLFVCTLPMLHVHMYSPTVVECLYVLSHCDWMLVCTLSLWLNVCMYSLPVLLYVCMYSPRVIICSYVLSHCCQALTCTSTLTLWININELFAECVLGTGHCQAPYIRLAICKHITTCLWETKSLETWSNLPNVMWLGSSRLFWLLPTGHTSSHWHVQIPSETLGLQDFTSFSVFRQISYHESSLRCWSDQTDSCFPAPSCLVPFHVLPGLHPPTETAFVLCFPPNNRPCSSASKGSFSSFIPYRPRLFPVCLLGPHSIFLFSNCLHLHFIHNQTTKHTGEDEHRHLSVLAQPQAHFNACVHTCSMHFLELTIFKPSLPGPSGLQAGFPLPTRNS